MVHRTDLDGVRVLWEPSDEPLRASLHFRVGEADETFPTHGITRLVTHLVRPSQRVGGTITTFADSGDDWLPEVCARLADLPTDDLDEACEALRVTDSGSRWPFGPAEAARCGPQGHGVRGYLLSAFAGLPAEQVRHWARTRFTKGNAVLVLNGGPHPGLRLPLPEGPATPPPPIEPLPRPFPVMRTKEEIGVALTVHLPHSAAAEAFLELLYRRARPLEDRLPLWLATERLTADVLAGAVWGWDDYFHTYSPETSVGLLDILYGLAEAPVAVDELPPPVEPSLDDEAARLLLGIPPRAHEEVTPADVQAVARHAIGTAVLVATRLIDDPRVTPMPTTRETIDWDDVVGVRANPGGSRYVIGSDGLGVLVPAEEAETVDSRVDPALIVHIPDDMPLAGVQKRPWWKRLLGRY